MKVRLEYLERCSAQTGYSVSPLEKVVRLGEMAGEIARHPLLREVMALKGGSALNLCYGPPKRLSVDLDYNYTGHRDRDKMLLDRPRVEDAVAELARRRGYRVQRSREAFAGRKMYLAYRSVLGPEERIELDLNFLFRVPIAGTEQRELWQPGELDQPRVRTVSLKEIVVGKMLAMLDRGAARDVWDLAHLPASATGLKDSPSFRAWFMALAAILDHPLPTYTLGRLEARVTRRVVAEQLAPMLAADAAPSADDLITNAWEAVGEFMAVKPNEEAYLAFVERGELRPELVFPDDPEAAQRIADHPAILWKLTNVRKHLARRAHKE